MFFVNVCPFASGCVEFDQIDPRQDLLSQKPVHGLHKKEVVNCSMREPTQ